jgi:hypothetical protein
VNNRYVVNTREVRGERLDAEIEELKKAQENGDPIEPGTQLSKEEQSWKKRHDDVKSYMQKHINELKKNQDELKTQLKDAAEKQIKFPKTEEEVTEWVTKYPDVAAIVKTIAMKEVAEVRKQLSERDEVLNQKAYEIEFNKNLARVVKAHDDFFELQQDEKFKEWLLKQPKFTREAFGEDIDMDDLEDAADTVIQTLRVYKMDNKPKETKPVDNRRDAVRQVVTRNSSTAPRGDARDDNMIYESEIAEMRDRDYTDAFHKEVTKAQREGRFVWDLSGGAR